MEVGKALGTSQAQDDTDGFIHTYPQKQKTPLSRGFYLFY